MIRRLPLGLFLLLLIVAHSAAATEKAEPFTFADFTWLNGADRQHTHLLVTPHLSADILVDAQYNFSGHNPVDDTLVGSTVVARHNEFSLLLASAGLTGQVGQAHIALSLQLGDRPILVSRNDSSVLRGQYDLQDAMRYIREAYAGYHFDVQSGLNIDVGLFMSYIGLFSYLNVENWAYQPSYVSDNTPFFFQGVRLQYFLSERVKFELWVVNGWQSYAKFNRAPGVGVQLAWRPNADWSLVSNGYVGSDTADVPKRVRLHSDTSVQWRYLQRPAQHGIGRAAVSVTFDLGGETGDGVVSLTSGRTTSAQNFLGVMAYHRLWFGHEKFALTLGGGFINNPGRYLVLGVPGGATDFAAPKQGSNFAAWDASITADMLPTEQVTLRLEGNLRHASTPYFAGHGGVTSASGLVSDLQSGFRADLRRSEIRATMALMVRM